MESERAVVLSRRFRWIDAVRRPLAILAGIVVGCLLILRYDLPSANSPVDEYIYPLALVVGIAVWWVAEVLFASAAAVFETEYSRLTRSPSIPRAEIHKK